MKTIFLPLFLFISMSLVSCKKETTVQVIFKVKNFSGKTDIGRAYSIDSNEYKILFSNFEYTDTKGKAKRVKDIFLLKNDNNSFSFNAPNGNYTSFRFFLGLDKKTNNTQPNSYPASHPLSVENSLYWDMLKYRFIVLEGKIDNSSTIDQLPSMPFSMHLGADTLYTKIPVTNEIFRHTNTIQITIDLQKLFVLDKDVFEIAHFSNHSEAYQIADAIAIKNSLINGITINQ